MINANLLITIRTLFVNCFYSLIIIFFNTMFSNNYIFNNYIFNNAIP